MAADLKLTLNGTPVPVYLGENATLALAQASRAEAAADAAAASEAVALAAAGPNYADTAAGLSATSEGETFAVEDDGIVTIYRHDSGPTATELRILPTTAALAATGGAALINTTQGRTAQDFFDYIDRDFFVSKYDEGSDTANLQAAIADAASFVASNPGARPRVIVPRRATAFAITNVTVSDDVEIDFDGSTVEWKPSVAAGGNDMPGIAVEGTRSSTTHAIEITVAGQPFVELSTEADASNYAAGDYIQIADSKAIPKYSDSGTTAYTGRLELNQVLEVDGAVLWLSKFVERAYDTSPTVRKMTKLPCVYIHGIAASTEEDAGEAWAGGSGDAPNLISLRYTYRSLVEDVNVDGFRAFAVHMQHSVDPITRRVEAKNCQYDTGGNGYLSRASTCLGARILDCRAENVRHLADDTQSVDTYSSGNRALRMLSSPYVTHGWDSKRYVSENDYCDGSTVTGWSLGNTSFAGDEGMTIINPIGRSLAQGIRCWAGSTGLTVENPNIQASDVGIAILHGAKNSKIIGGRVDVRHAEAATDWTHGCGIAVRAEAVFGGESYATPPENVTIEGVEVLGPLATSRAEVVYVDASGDINVSRNKIVGGGATLTGGLLYISPVTAAESVRCVGNETDGAASRSLLLAVAPTGTYDVTHNRLLATNTTLASNIKTSSRLRFLFNEKVAGNYSWQGDSLATAINGGTLAFGNSPQVGQASLVADPAGGTTVDTEARAAIASLNELLKDAQLMARS